MKASLEGLKIVSPTEMVRLEALAAAEGASLLQFMENAGQAIAEATLRYLEEKKLPKIVTLLVGKGNNGGDAYAAGAQLCKRGFLVTAWHIYPLEVCSSLCRLMHEKFLGCGGSVHFVTEEPGFHIQGEGVLLDGLLGTGFQGRAEGVLALAIAQANSAFHPIFAIDIPSGLNGTTGEVSTVAIRATKTFFYEMPKIGFFIQEGWNHIGELEKISFGWEEKFYQQANPVAFLLNEKGVSSLLPPLQRTRHKYQAGYVLGIAGSSRFPGAAFLASSSALSSGAGIVRLFYPPKMQAHVSAAPYELICEPWEQGMLPRIEEEAKHAKAAFLGPGMGRDGDAFQRVYQILKILDLPIVIDADALFILAKTLKWKLPATAILTPHRQEMQRLLDAFCPNAEGTFLEQCQQFAEHKQITLVIKGAPHFIFHPATLPLCVPRGDPGMATAGSGDVLTGIIAAMLAQGVLAKGAAVLGVYLHAVSGELAAKNLSSYCITASSLLQFLPQAFVSLVFA